MCALSQLFWSKNKKQLHAFCQLCTFGECGEMWQNVRRYGELLLAIVSKGKLTALANYVKAFTKCICTRFTNCGCGGMYGMLGMVGRCAKRLPSKSYVQVWKTMIINCKLPFSANYFDVTVKSTNTRATNCGHGECEEMCTNLGNMGNSC